MRKPILTCIAVALCAHTAEADDFANALKDHTGDPSRVAALRFTTFKVGPKCLARLPDKAHGALHAASYATRDFLDYAKAATGQDHGADEARVAAFGNRFHVTVAVEGDDCDAKSNALWLRYWTQLASAVAKYPPRAGKVTIALDVAAKHKDVSSTVSKDGATFTFTAPRDIEVAEWGDKLERPFRKLVTGLPDDYAFGLQEYTGRYASAFVLTKLTTLKVGARCAAKLGDKREGALHAASFYTRDILEYAKLVGGDDWDRIEQQSNNDALTNRGIVDRMMSEFAGRLQVTVVVEGDDCDAKQGALWLKQWTQIGKSLRDHPPRANKVAITLTVTSRAKDVAIASSGDGSSFTITGPRDVEPSGWSDKLDAAFKKVARKQ